MTNAQGIIAASLQSTIRPSTQRDIDEVELTLREGDRRECEILGSREIWHQKLENFESCWTIHINGKMVGYCGVGIPIGGTALSPIRWLCFLSTTNVDSMKLSFVKESRNVLKAIIESTPSYVTTFYSMPMADYRGSVIWHKRILKMQEINHFNIFGHEHILFKTTRKEMI
jgi:hypothetical protein